MGKKKAIAEVLHADLDTTLSDKLYERVYTYLKENDSFVFFNIMEFKFTTLLDNPINDNLEYKIMHFMMLKMKENHPVVLAKLLQGLQSDSATFTAAKEQ